MTRRSPRTRPAWWQDRVPAPEGPLHWHVAEQWWCNGVADATSEVDLVASTEDVAWRVVIGRAGQLMLDDWSLDEAPTLEEVVLQHGVERVVLRTWRCELPSCHEEAL